MESVYNRRRHIVVKEALCEVVCKNIIQTIANEGSWDPFSKLVQARTQTKGSVDDNNIKIVQKADKSSLAWRRFNGKATLYDINTKKVYKVIDIFSLLENDLLGLTNIRPKRPCCYVISRNLKKIKEDLVISS